MTSDPNALPAVLTRMVWESRRAEVIEYLVYERPLKQFSRPAADRAFQSFIETMVFVAEETGIPQLGRKS